MAEKDLAKRVQETFGVDAATASNVVRQTAQNRRPATSPTSGPGAVQNQDFSTEIQNRLLKQSGVVSSLDTQLEEALSGGTEAIQSSTEASAARLEGQFGRNIEEAQRQQGLSVQQQLEQRRGFGTNMVALRNLVETTDKQINDLRDRKEELILQNNAQGAAQIAQLEFQALQFRQQAEQQVFSNLLGMGQLSVQQSSEARLARAQDFTEQSAKASIALQYGVDASPNDTLDSVIAKALPKASEQQTLELQKTRADIARINAETARALQGAKSAELDDITITGIAQAARLDSSVLATLTDAKQRSLVINKMSELEKPYIEANVNDNINSGKSLNKTIEEIQSDTSILNKGDAIKKAEELYDSTPAAKTSSFEEGRQAAQSVKSGVSSAGQAIGGFISGFNSAIPGVGIGNFGFGLGGF